MTTNRNMLTFIKHVFYNQKKKYLLLFLILTLLASFEFSFLAIYTSFGHYDFDFQTTIALNSIPFISLIVAVTLSIFVVNYFISNKSQEFSVLLLSGRKPVDLFKYLLIQFGSLVVISFGLGIAGGVGIMFIINSAQESAHLNYNFIVTLFMHLCLLCITFTLILAISSKQFVALDKDLSHSLTHRKAKKTAPYVISFSSITKKKKFPIFSIISTFLIIYLMIINISTLMSSNLSFDSLLTSFMRVLAGEIIIVNTTIPMLYDLLHDSILLKHPILMNSLSSFNNFCLSMITLINLNAVIVPLLLFILFFSSTETILQVILFPCFLMIITMIGLCILLRYTIYEENVRSHVATLHAIGYSPKQLNLISLIKNSLFILFGFIIPLMFLIQLLIKAYNEFYISKDIMFLIMGSYILVFTGLSIYMLIKERLTQKEVVHDVKYINRS